MPKIFHLLPNSIDSESEGYDHDVRLTLKRNENSFWWDVGEIRTTDWNRKCSSSEESLTFITISERAGVQSKSFNVIAKFLIGFSSEIFSRRTQNWNFFFHSGSSAKLTLIGVYASLVYVLWLTCFRRTLFSDIQLIMFQEWPLADRVERLCQEVNLVRELGELQLEEELFARLLFLHRSAETLVGFTRPKTRSKNEQNDFHGNLSHKRSIDTN